MSDAERIAAFPADVRDRAAEWVAVNVDIDGDDEAAYDEAVLSACLELAAIDAAADRANAAEVSL